MKRRRVLSTIMMMVAVLIMSLNAQAAVKISKKSATLIKGQSLILKVTGTKEKVKWSTNKKKVATVTQKGVVKAKAKGTATISAKVGKKTYKCKVKVETPKISKTKATLNVGQKLTLKITGNTQKVKWTTSDEVVVAVSKRGVITATNAGIATITATISSKKYKCRVTVKDVFSANKTVVSLVEETTSTVRFTYTGLSELNYDIEKPEIVSCEWGEWDNYFIDLRIYGESVGNTIITISDEDGKSIKISVAVRSYYTDKEIMAGAVITYMKERTLKDPSSLQIISIWDAYNDVEQDDASIEHHEFVVIEYLAKNSYGANIRSYAEITVVNKEMKYIGYTITDSRLNKMLWVYDNEKYPSVIKRGTINTEKALKYADSITFA